MSRRGRKRKKKRAVERRKMDRRRRTSNRCMALRRAVTPLGEHGIGFDPRTGTMKFWKSTLNGQSFKLSDGHSAWVLMPYTGWFVIEIIIH